MVDTRSILHVVSVLRLPMDRVQHPHLLSNRVLVDQCGGGVIAHTDVPRTVHPADIRGFVGARKTRVEESAGVQRADGPDWVADQGRLCGPSHSIVHRFRLGF